MSRTKRILYDNAIYHIINRGHNRQILFRKNEDFDVFTNIIGRYVKKHNFSLYNYCVMSNHFHMLLQTKKAHDLPLIMKGICQTYANYYKREYGKVGYLFQNRYKSIPIERNEYLSECARYIERNPLRAKIVEDLSNYRYSSYNCYANGEKNDIIKPNILYEDFGNNPEERRINYVKYITEPRPYEALLDKVISEMK